MRQRFLRNVSGTDLFMWFIGASILVVVIYGSIASITSGRYSGENWLDFIVAGLAQGGVYALIALGYTLVYGILLMINFAHGEVFMAGAFTAFFVADAFSKAGYFRVQYPIVKDLLALVVGLLVAVVTFTLARMILERTANRLEGRNTRLAAPALALGVFLIAAKFFYDAGRYRAPSSALKDLFALGVVFLVAMVTSLVVAVFLERVAYRPLRRAPRLVPLITAIGASFFLQYTFRGLYGSGIKTYPDVQMMKGELEILGFGMLQIQVVIIIVAVLMMIGLWWFVQNTKTGKAMRAVSEDKDVAALMGIDVDRVIVFTFAIGAALAGAAGVLYALLFKQVNFFMGFFPGLKAFTAAVLGGIGNIPGAMLGGFSLGIFESLGPSLFLEGVGIPAAYQLKDVIAFTMLVLVLIFRPSGILGERLSEQKA